MDNIEIPNNCQSQFPTELCVVLSWEPFRQLGAKWTRDLC
jgi:hypothetical protein